METMQKISALGDPYRAPSTEEFVAAIQAMDMSQYAICRLLGISVSMMSRCMHGTRHPTCATWRLIMLYIQAEDDPAMPAGELMGLESLDGWRRTRDEWAKKKRKPAAAEAV